MIPHTAGTITSRMLPIIAGLVLFCVTLLATYTSHVYENDRRSNQFDQLAYSISEQFSDQMSTLLAISGLLNDGSNADRERLVAFLEIVRPFEHTPGMQGVGFALAVPTGDTQAAEQQLLKNYGKPIAVKPGTDQPVRFPIVLLEPNDARNAAALGYDMFSEKTRRDAMMRALNTGNPSATDIVELVQEIDGKKQPGFLVYLPIYQRSNSSVVELPGKLPIWGFVYAPYRVHDFVNAAIGSHLAKGAGIEIRTDSLQGNKLLFSQGVLNGAVAERSLNLADKKWSLLISGGERHFWYNSTFLIFVAGTLLSLLTAALLIMQANRIQVLSELDGERYRRIEQKDMMLGEMNHRIKNSFARTIALSRLTRIETNDMDEFQELFQGRMMALSKAQDMLVGGTSGNVRLRDILRSELETAGKLDGRDYEFEGPLVDLSPASAQTLALTLHELATNSIKYGALSGQGSLRVEWTRNDDAMIKLTWRESQLAFTPDLRNESFGSRFIKSMVESQLGGKLQRSTSEQALEVCIEWAESKMCVQPA